MWRYFVPAFVFAITAMTVPDTAKREPEPVKPAEVKHAYVDIVNFNAAPLLTKGIHARELLRRYHFGRLNKYRHAIMAGAMRYDLDPYLIAAVMWQESKGNMWAIGGVGEVGLMQIRPKYHLTDVPRRYWFSPGINVMRGSKYLRHCIDLRASLWIGVSCYNTGESADFINYSYAQAVRSHYLKMRY